MSEERFNVVVHRGGTLVNDFPFEYVGGEMTYWRVDPDKWSYFEVVDAIKELGYIKVTNIFYCVQNILHKLVDDRGAMNMVNVAKYFGEVRLFVVHGMDDEPEVLENEVSEQVLLLCHGSLDSGEDSHVADLPEASQPPPQPPTEAMTQQFEAPPQPTQESREEQTRKRRRDKLPIRRPCAL
ncbi:uncharacterized protein HKW66_Vig0026610 [Vigna angularis]|uniref:PB1-like domain-containing protein n=1 Tax=Phaseolus angularis TaxID=3914 RepID=A0A8T0L7C8_PHAAN|nr:uncharacterized protein HKW66_Vig0026610 [Vigna angularis]